MSRHRRYTRRIPTHLNDTLRSIDLEDDTWSIASTIRRGNYAQTIYTYNLLQLMHPYEKPLGHLSWSELEPWYPNYKVLQWLVTCKFITWEQVLMYLCKCGLDWELRRWNWGLYVHVNALCSSSSGRVVLGWALHLAIHFKHKGVIFHFIRDAHLLHGICAKLIGMHDPEVVLRVPMDYISLLRTCARGGYRKNILAILKRNGDYVENCKSMNLVMIKHAGECKGDPGLGVWWSKEFAEHVDRRFLCWEQLSK